MKNTIAVLAIALVPACGGSNGTSATTADATFAPDDAAVSVETGGPTKGGTDGKTVTSGCEHAPALCTKLNACAPFLLKAVYGDTAKCADRLTQACTQQSLSPGTGMTESAIVACEAALSTATCRDLFANNVAACSFKGTLENGSKCGDNSQCASGFCAHGGDLCGACTPKASAGAPCPSGSNDECVLGLVCTAGKVCASPAAPGGACDDNTQPCMTGSFCTTAKTCALTVAAGADCPGAFLNVAEGTLCSGRGTATNPQTAKQIGTAAAGETCGLAPGENLGPTLCAPGSTAACTLSPGGIQLFGVPTKGMCAAEKPDGWACTATDICQAGAQCISGTCQIPSGRYCL